MNNLTHKPKTVLITWELSTWKDKDPILKDKGRYFVSVNCPNCSKAMHCYILKGIPIKQCPEIKCLNCECDIKIIPKV